MPSRPSKKQSPPTPSGRTDSKRKKPKAKTAAPAKFNRRRSVSAKQRAIKSRGAGLEVFQNAFDKSRFGKSLTRPDGTIQANQALADMMGYPVRDIEGRDWRDYTHPDDIEGTQKKIDALLSGAVESVRFTKRYVHKDGHTVWAELGSTLRRDENGRPLYLITDIIDITERKLIEEKLAASERRFRQLADLLPQYVFETDIQGNLTFTNQYSLDSLGFSVEELRSGLKIDSVFSPEDVEDVHRRFKEVLGGSAVAAREYQLMRKNGEKFPVLLHATAVLENEVRTGIRGIAIDITERKRHEEELRESEDKFKYVFDHSVIGKSITLLSGQVHSNKALSDLLGYSPEELNQRRWQDITHPDDIGPTQKALDAMVSGKKDSMRLVKRYIHKNGSIVWGDLSTSLRRDQEGRPLYLMSSVLDVTERKRAEEVLGAQKAQLSLIYDNIYDVIFTIKVEPNDHFRFSSVNRRFLEVAGLREDQVVGKPVQEVIPEPAHRLVFGKYRESIRNKRPARWEEVSVYPAGEKVGDVTIAPIFNAQGECTQLIGTVHDITERKQAENALRESEKKYRAMMDQAADSIFVHDETGRIVDVNRMACQTLGYSREELLSKSIGDIDPEAIKTGKLKLWGRILGGEHATFESGQIRKDGSPIPVEVTLGSVRLPDGPAILGIARDITERKLAQGRIQLAQDVLACLNRREGMAVTIRHILQTIKTSTGVEALGIRLREGDDYPYCQTSGFPEHFVELERTLCARDEAGGLLRDARGNPILECMCGNILCGRTDPKLPFFTEGGSFWSNSTTDLLASTTEEDRQARTRNRCNGEDYESVALIPLRSADKIIGLLQLNDHRPNQFTPEMIKFFEASGASVGVALSHAQAEESLAAERGILRTLIDSLPDNVFIKDTQGRIILDNLTHRRFLGRQELDDVEGKTDKDFFSSALADQYMADERRIIESGRPMINYEEPTVDREGRPHWYLTTKAPVRDSRGAITALVGINRDITERKKAEDRIQQSLREKDILLREVYHRTKNNMNVITALLSLRSESCADEATARALKDIEDRIMAMALVHQKLYRSPDLSRIDMREYLTDLSSLLMTTAQQPAGRIVLKIEAEPLRVPIDTAIPLGMIFTELFSNVSKHAAPADAEVAVRLRLARSGPGEIELMFSDDGVGMPPGFDFHSNRTLGLQTVFMLAEHQLQGRCDFESGRGVSCRIRIPEPDPPEEART